MPILPDAAFRMTAPPDLRLRSPWERRQSVGGFGPLQVRGSPAGAVPPLAGPGSRRRRKAGPGRARRMRKVPALTAIPPPAPARAPSWRRAGRASSCLPRAQGPGSPPDAAARPQRLRGGQPRGSVN